MFGFGLLHIRSEIRNLLHPAFIFLRLIFNTQFFSQFGLRAMLNPEVTWHSTFLVFGFTQYEAPGNPQTLHHTWILRVHRIDSLLNKLTDEVQTLILIVVLFLPQAKESEMRTICTPSPMWMQRFKTTIKKIVNFDEKKKMCPANQLIKIVEHVNTFDWLLFVLAMLNPIEQKQ